MTTSYIDINSPTTSQLNALAYAPMPFAWLSFLSSSYMIYFLLCKHHQRLHRLYHRLVLSMNIALVPLSLMYAWSTLAVPEGTIGYVGASGNVNTCTAQGFISLVFSLAVPTYYGAFVLQAFMGIKNNFNEQKYVWIEKWIHMAAYLIPSAYAIIIAATNNFNPNGSGCWYAKWPKGCDNSNPDAPQCRGDDIDLIMYIIGFTQIFLYFIFPPVVISSMYCWIRRIRKEAATKSCNGGMLAVRETARREMMQSIYRQISIYLGSFWAIWVPGLISNVYTILTADMLYNLQIFCNCIFAFQGFVFTMVYFVLQTIGRPKTDIQPIESQVRTTNITTMSSTSGCRSQQRLTVSDIRLNAKRKAEIEDAAAAEDDDLLAESYCFNIFDGTPDEASPWAQFIDPDSDNEDDDEDKETPDEEQGGMRTGSPS